MRFPVVPVDRERIVSVPLSTVVAAAIIGFLAGVNLIWLQLNMAPPTWDEANYLETTELIFQAFQSRNPEAFWSAWVNSAFGSKAPLVSLLPLPAFFLLGNTKFALDLTLVALSVSFGWTCFGMCTALTGDRRLAVVATTITGTMPVVYGLSRAWLVEYGLTVLVMAWVWTLVRSDCLRRGGFSPLLGILLGVGMLMKVSFAGLILVPAVWGILTHFRRYGLTMGSVWRVSVNWTVILGVGGTVAATWYLPNRNYEATIEHARLAATATNYAAYGTSNTWGGTAEYVRDLLVQGVSLPLAVLATALLLFHLARRLTSRVTHPAATRPQNAAILLAAWPGVMFLLSFSTLVKDLRYLLPTFPAIGAGIAWLLVSAFTSPRARAGAVSSLLAAPVLVFLLNSLPFGPQVAWGAVNWWVFGEGWGYVSRPVRGHWPNEAIISAIAKDAPQHVRGPSGEDPLVLAVVDRPFLNQHTLRYQTTHLGLNTRMHWSAVLTSPGQTDIQWREMLAWIRQAKYLVTTSGQQGPRYSSFRNGEILAMLEAGALPYSELASFKLPDGAQATVYHMNREDVSIVDLGQTITQPARVISWETYLADSDSMRLKVWRQVAQQFLVVAQSDLVSGTAGRNVIKLSRPLEVATGEIAGVYTANGSIRLLPLDGGDGALRKQLVFDGDVTRGPIASGRVMPQQLDLRLRLGSFDEVGVAPANRPVSMKAPNSQVSTWIDYSKPISSNGLIDSWILTAADATTFRLKIWRPAKDGWWMIAESPIEHGEPGVNRYFLNPPISVRAGDYVGFSTAWRTEPAGSSHPFPIANMNCGHAKGSGWVKARPEQGDYRGQVAPDGFSLEKECFQIQVFTTDAKHP